MCSVVVCDVCVCLVGWSLVLFGFVRFGFVELFGSGKKKSKMAEMKCTLGHVLNIKRRGSTLQGDAKK